MAIEITVQRKKTLVESSDTGVWDPIVGIDLGTTNSLVAVVRPGQNKPEVLPLASGRHLLPSVVSFKAGMHAPAIGDYARERKLKQSQDTVFSVKRLLGRGYADVAGIRDQLPYHVVEGVDGGPVRVQVGDRAYTAVEISALILRELKQSAEAALGVAVKRAVITVPAYFNDAQRQATRAAGRLAGLQVLRIVNEPTAAALAYGLDRKRHGVVAVYDLGGGTFDVSILKIKDGVFEVLATHGDTALGGDDLDRALAQELRERADRKGAELDASPETLAVLLEAAERTKIALSQADTAVALVRDHEIRVTREEFNRLAQPILDRTRGACERALQDAGLSTSDLSDVILVGGPTRLSVVQETARTIFGRKPNTSMHPDEVVAAGAAIQANILSGSNRELLLLDVTPLSLGIETYGGLMSPLILRNSRIPTQATEFFTTFVDNQTGVDIHVLQGERDRADENRSLARFKLKGIAPAPAASPRIEVSFLIDADGILQVSARDLKSGNEQSIEVKPSFGLSETEIERLLAAGLDHAAEDVGFRRLVEARTEAEPVLRVTESRLADARKLLDAESVQAIESQVAGLRVALQGQDPEAIRTQLAGLNHATTRLAELLVQQAIRTAETKSQSTLRK